MRVPGWPGHTTQAGDGIRDILDAMGADVRLARDHLEVTGAGGISGIDVDLHDVSELTPVVAALAVLAYSFVVTYVIALVLKATIGFRISDEAEAEGIDGAEHAESAYEFSGIGARAFSPRTSTESSSKSEVSA